MVLKTETQRVDKNRKKLNSFSIKEMQIKTAMRFHVRLVKQGQHMLVRIWYKGDTHPLMVEFPTCTTTIKTSPAISQESGSIATS